ncbi:MAG: CoA pyrophosphatase [Chloroflexota bacterium]
MDNVLATIKQSLELDDFDVLAAQMKLAPMPRPLVRPLNKPGSPRISAVLMLLYCHDDALHVALTRRRADLKAHPGQISFPGGRNEPPETLQTTALRETEEEVGIPSELIEVVGTLTTIYIPPSDFIVHPFVGWTKNGRRPPFAPSPDEVAEMVEVPISQLLKPDSHRREARTAPNGMEVNVPYFAVNERTKVWGGTAVILSEFLERWKVVNER